MSDRPIEVGDLVIIVRWPCCGAKIGRIFKVEKFYSHPFGIELACSHCGHVESVNEPVAWDGQVNGIGANISYLKRIPPGLVSDDVPAEEPADQTCDLAAFFGSPK